MGDLATAVLSDVAPEELADFDTVLRGFDTSARAHQRAQHGVEQETATGIAEAGEVLGGIVLAAGSDLLKDAVKDGAKRSGRRIASLFPRRSRARSSTPLPPLSPDRAEKFRVRAAELCAQYGAPPATARAIAESVVARWPSAPPR